MGSPPATPPSTPPKAAARSSAASASVPAPSSALVAPSAPPPFPARPFLRLGATVDARDTEGDWLRARVTDVDLAGARVHLRYHYWRDRWSVWRDAASPDVLPRGSEVWQGTPRALRVGHRVDVLVDEVTAAAIAPVAAATAQAAATSAQPAPVASWRQGIVTSVTACAGASSSSSSFLSSSSFSSAASSSSSGAAAPGQIRVIVRLKRQRAEVVVEFPRQSALIAPHESRTRAKYAPSGPGSGAEDEGESGGGCAEAAAGVGAAGKRRRRATGDRERRPASTPESTDPRLLFYLQTLAAQGLELAPMGGDGNCLFRSVAHQIYGDENEHSICRGATADYMAIESAFFSSFVVEADNGGGFAAYVDEIRRDGTWGDDPEVQALCEIYNRPAEVWAYDATRGAVLIRVFHGAASASASSSSHDASSSMVTESRPPIRLSYFGGGHYDSIVRRSDWRAHHLPPGSAGLHEGLMLQTARLRHARLSGGGPVSAQGAVGAALSESDREATELATLQAVLAASRAQWEASHEQWGASPLFATSSSATASSSSSASSTSSASVTASLKSSLGLAMVIEEDERLDLASALQRSAVESKTADQDDLERSLVEAARQESLAIGGGSNSMSASASGSSALWDAASKLTEDEQVQCLLAGLLPEQFLSQRACQPAILSTPRPQHAATAEDCADAEADNEFQLALLLSTQQP